MGKLIDGLLDYLANTSQEQIKKDLERLDKYKDVGPNVDAFINQALERSNLIAEVILKNKEKNSEFNLNSFFLYI